MKAVVMFMSRGGNTRKAAELIGTELADRGVEVVVRPVDGLDFNEVSEADFVCVGTWVHGLFIVGQHPGDMGKLAKIPMLWDKPVGAFMTYALNAGGALKGFEQFLEGDLGANVIGGALMKRNNLDDHVRGFVDHILAEMEQVPSRRTSGILS